MREAIRSSDLLMVGQTRCSLLVNAGLLYFYNDISILLCLFTAFVDNYIYNTAAKLDTRILLK